MLAPRVLSLSLQAGSSSASQIPYVSVHHTHEYSTVHTLHMAFGSPSPQQYRITCTV